MYFKVILCIEKTNVGKNIFYFVLDAMHKFLSYLTSEKKKTSEIDLIPRYCFVFKTEKKCFAHTIIRQMNHLNDFFLFG